MGWPRGLVRIVVTTSTGPCICLTFLTWDVDGRPLGRVERYPGCPEHWRIAEDEYAIPRESRLVLLDDFLALIQG